MGFAQQMGPALALPASRSRHGKQLLRRKPRLLRAGNHALRAAKLLGIFKEVFAMMQGMNELW